MSNLILIFLILTGFFLRIYGLTENYSFWSDESHVAIFARAILENGKPVLENGYSTGVYQWLQNWVSAFSAKVFGLSEFSIRFPSVIFGVLTIWAIYLFGKELFNKRVGLLAAFFTTFLKIEILWSRQARPYQALQFFYLICFYFLFKLLRKEKGDSKWLLGFLFFGVLAPLFHGLGIIILLNGLLLLVLSIRVPKKIILGGLALLLLGVFFWPKISANILNLGKINNFFYYRVFLMHNYLILCFLSLFGAARLLAQKAYMRLMIFISVLPTQMFVVSFLLNQPFIRYFYIVLPFIILLSSFALVQLTKFLSTRFLSLTKLKRKTMLIHQLFIIILIFGVVAILDLGNKLVLVPQKIYSLNEDMQEIPEVDWKKLYSMVEKKLRGNPDTVLATNWNDLPAWYLKAKKVNFLVRRSIHKIDPFTGAKTIYSTEDFEKMTEENKAGIFVLDSWDDAVPEGVREYCHKNLKRELEIDRLYPVQPRFWTVWVYSWGIK